MQDVLPDASERLSSVESRELMYQSERTRILRVTMSGRPGSMIRKERLGADGAARVRNERRILKRLSGVTGIVQVVPADVPERVLTLDDTGGRPLRQLIGVKLSSTALVDLAYRIALIVAQMHRRGVLHKDINPDNLLLTSDDQEPVLIDFDLATTLAEDRPRFVHHSEIAGTLAYLAPEQTGRTGRQVDCRADLYALGVTLYELATGKLPFAGADPLQLIHDHLVRVPTPPVEMVAEAPVALSDIIMKLLEKEPDRRYQSAEGLAHDLSRLGQALRCKDALSFPLGERDFPLRLAAPSRLFGRTAETAALGSAFDEAAGGRARAVMIAGASGCGKTALIDQLRSIVAARRGWFLTGKFDQYRRESVSGAIEQVMHALASMLLAEPDAVLAVERKRLLDALGPLAGIVIHIIPEFAKLLGETPQILPTDSRQAEIQVRRACATVLRTMASPQRPLVVVIDDLQWAPSPAIQFIDALIEDEVLSGLLLIGAYRDAEVDVMHPLRPRLTAWQQRGAASIMQLDNLARADLGGMLAEILRLPSPDAARLADAIGPRTAGNPFDTVELINALRVDGVLSLGDRGWHWDESAIQRHIGRSDVIDLLERRIAMLPGRAVALLQMLSCLGSEVPLDVLQIAAGLDTAVMEDLGPSLDDGLIIIDGGGELSLLGRESTVRFRHDRIQQATHDSLRSDQRLAHELAAGRRLAASAGHRSRAAELYLAAIDQVVDADEGRQVAGLFQEAAAEARHAANYPMAERLLAAARKLLREATPGDQPLLAVITADHHRVLFGLGRFQEADELYASIERDSHDPLDHAASTCVQISSLSCRGKLGEALALGLEILGRLGLDIPADIEGAILHRLPQLQRSWAECRGGPAAGSLSAINPRAQAIGTLLTYVSLPAHLINPPLRAWIVLESYRLWQMFGSDGPFMNNLGVAPLLTIGWGNDYRTGYEIARQVVTIGESRQFDPNAFESRLCFMMFSAPWFEPLEHNAEQARRVRSGFAAAGELQMAAVSYYCMLLSLFECADTLDEFEIELEAALAFVARTGNELEQINFLFYRQMLRALRGETCAPGELSDDSFDAEKVLSDLTASPSLAGIQCAKSAVAAAMFQDLSGLKPQSDAAMDLMPAMTAFYEAAWIHLVNALALAAQYRIAAPCDQSEILAKIDGSRDWLAARAADNPVNFLHLLRLVEAERAWAVGEVLLAARTFESAVREAEQRKRPWHRALIAERAGRFNLAQGMDHAGRALLSSSHRQYQAWGARAKVGQLEREHPFLRGTRAATSTASRHSSGVSSDAIDLLAVLRVSQALSSETSLHRLQGRVAELLGAMTGATGVTVTLWKDDPPGWYLPMKRDDSDFITTAEAGRQGTLPFSAVQYAERTLEPLLIEDAMDDPRFASDSYFSGSECCSLLILPILKQGSAKAMLILENRLSRGAFSIDRLDAVELIAGQLAVSLDNALLYDTLERKVAERTAALEKANQHLETLSITDALTGLANRRRFSEVLAAEWQRALRFGHSVGMLLMDVDHFKQYNDHYGHVAGDNCLQQVAKALGASGRRGVDLVARYGGEEFAIIVVEAGIDVVVAVAQRALAAVEALREPHEVVERGFVTVSIGIAAATPSQSMRPEEMIAAADAALYAAKRGGRNQVCAEPLDAPPLAPGADNRTSLKAV